jgi:hypothetical protein
LLLNCIVNFMETVNAVNKQYLISAQDRDNSISGLSCISLNMGPVLGAFFIF